VVDYVPLPPDEREKYLYYGSQGRWIFCVFLLAFAGVMFGLARLAANSMWTSLLYELIALQVVAVGISLLSSTRKRRSSRAEHDALVGGYRPVVFPSVDVFLPSAGESLAILDNTYRHVARLDWPGRLIVHVLDDSARDFRRRPRRAVRLPVPFPPDAGVLKKAGNLRYGYENSDGDLIHVSTPISLRGPT
jgi:cellulose synthase (UDP-forming)